jgi:hypothetical protein
MEKYMKKACLGFGLLCAVSPLCFTSAVLAGENAVCPSQTYQQRDLAGGIACAIQPSRTDSAITDLGSSGRGFGYHVIGIPSDPTQIKGTFLYLGGSGDRPFDPDGDRYSNLEIVENGIALGYMVIQLAHANTDPVGILCGNNDACYGATRQEIIYGTATSSAVSVNTANSIMNRLSALSRFLKSNYSLSYLLPAALSGTKVNWSKMRLGGSSQGGGHAGHIARDNASQRVCFLSSPVDTVTVSGDTSGSRQSVSAAWVSDTTWKTPTSQLRGVAHEDDDYFESITTNYKTLGMKESTSETNPNNNWVRITVDAGNPHTAPGRDGNLAYAREWSCFK